MIKPRIFNTLSKKIEEIVPSSSDHIRIYTCGPTVYDSAHIGNLSSYIYADTLRRALNAWGFNVEHVMNFTDVDDKTINKSQSLYPDLTPMEALKKTTRKYEELFRQDFSSVGCDLSSIKFYRATESIEFMQDLISRLYKEKIAYIASDGVYFSIENYKAKGRKYGQLTNITAQSTGRQRVNNDEYDKDNIHDFALWKTKKEGEPYWEFELESNKLDGRPGWHIECSAMSEHALGVPFDIHTGGVDLIFPHHENEIAQSTAAGENTIFAKYFMHNEHMLVDDKKMSKSLKNFFTLSDIKNKDFDPLAFRLLVLHSHYRSQTNFTWSSLEASQNRLKIYRAFAALKWQTVKKQSKGKIDFDKYYYEIKNSLAEDLNTAMALTQFDACVDQTIDSLLDTSEKQIFDNFLKQIDDIFGLNLSGVKNISLEQKQLIQKREELRASRKFDDADVIRKDLLNTGIEIRDTQYGAIWNPV